MSDITRRGFVKGAALAPLAFSPLARAQQTESAQPTARGPAERFDFVIAGAGHNSLITAAYLAKAGYRVVVLEGRPMVGGDVKTAEVTLVGFHHDTCSSAHVSIQENPVLRDKELNLEEYGLEYINPDPVFHMPFLDGGYVTQWHQDLDRTCETFAQFSKKDAAAYRRMYHESESMPAQSEFWKRRAGMSAWEVIRDNFEDWHSRCFMMAHPWSLVPAQYPMTGRIAYGGFRQLRIGRPLPKGGSGKLSEALARFIEAHHGVVLTNKPVARLIVEAGKCRGVECVDGARYRAEKAVVSTIHIKQLVDMAPRELWGADFIDGVNTWQAECQMFVTHFAATEPPKFTVAGGTVSPVHTEILASPERALRFAYDYAARNVNTDEPPQHIICCTVADPSRAPAGMHTIKSVAYQPYDLKEGPEHWDKIKEQVADANLAYLRRYAPNLTDDKILMRIVDSPLDLERMNPHNWHGSCHAGSKEPGQAGANRPVPGWSDYRMPIPGLYQTGACTAPGGSVTGIPGRNCAAVVLKDFGTSIEEVVKRGA